MTATRQDAEADPSAGSRVQSFGFAMLSDVGRLRSGNEDYCAAVPDSGLFVVCDGMGGAAAGEVASRLAAETFLAEVQARLAGEAVESMLQGAVEAANVAVRRQARAETAMRGMGTTLVALLQREEDDLEGRLWLVHVGDSRCYRLRKGKLEPLTNDHSLVQEQIQAGQITPEQAERSPLRNIITRAIGAASAVQAEIRCLSLEPGDLFMLASDGLTRDLTDAALAGLLDQADAADRGGLEAACGSLVRAANAAGGRDNVTVLLLRFERRTALGGDEAREQGLHWP